jgi:hypothetical protein
MTLESRLRDAVDETVTSQRLVDDRLGDLRRMRRHRTAQRAAMALAAVAVVAAGLAVQAHRPSTPQPAPHPPNLRGGAVLAITTEGAVTQVRGPRLPHLPTTAVATGPFRFTRDGSSLVYAAGGGVHRLDLRSGTDDALGECPDRACTVAYNEDASRSALAVDHYIVVSDVSSGETTTIAIGASAKDLAWSPGNAALAFVTRRGGTATLETLDLDSRRRSRLVRLQAGDYFATGPVWSPDAHQIAFVVHAGPVDVDSHLLLETVTTQDDPRSSLLRTLDICTCRAYAPGIAWSPDGTRLATTLKRAGSAGGPLSSLRRDGTGWRPEADGTFTGRVAWQPLIDSED